MFLSDGYANAKIDPLCIKMLKYLDVIERKKLLQFSAIPSAKVHDMKKAQTKFSAFITTFKNCFNLSLFSLVTDNV